MSQIATRVVARFQIKIGKEEYFLKKCRIHREICKIRIQICIFAESEIREKKEGMIIIYFAADVDALTEICF